MSFGNKVASFAIQSANLATTQYRDVFVNWLRRRLIDIHVSSEKRDNELRALLQQSARKRISDETIKP